MKELSLNNCRLDKRYDIREQLGRGSYAEVYSARDIFASPQSPHSQVVIKALNVFLQDDTDVHLERTLVENFQIEATALDRVRHPNIISRLGHGTARDLRGTVFHYLVLEYLAGGDLQKFVRQHKVTPEQAFGFIEQVAAGLGHAHSRGIIHRDIKPQNLLLTADHSTVKIADFGVARDSSAESPITRVGTNIYAPPEHSPLSAGQTGLLAFPQVTPAADVYSLAKSAYTLLSGEAPRAFANEPITALPDDLGRQEWAADLLRVLGRATQRDARERQQSVGEFWHDLARVRQMALEGEFSTVMRSAASAPQPHVSRGYSPLAPEKPRFEAVVELPSDDLPPTRNSARSVSIEGQHLPPVNGDSVERGRESNLASSASHDAQAPAPKKRGRALVRFGAFVVIACIFAGILYGTATFFRGRSILPEIRNPFSARTAVATTDIYLRPGPNTDNEPIGLVTKNSTVRIVNSQNNWYQIDVIEQGRVRASQVNATRGWLNGKYLNLQ